VAAIDLSAGAVLRRVEWTVLRPLDGALQGDFATLFRGEGIDFREMREYVPGDDLRRIDWNTTARMDTPYVRDYSEDRDLTAWLLLDRSASMRFGPTGRGKDAIVVDLVACFAQLLGRGGNKLGAVLFDDGPVATIPPRSGRTQVLRLIHELGRREPRSQATTELAGLLRAAVATIRQRSLVVVISDFISPPGWEKPLRQLAQRHDVMAIQIVDPLEHSLPDVGVIVLQDNETGDQVVVDTGDAGFRSRMAALAEEQNDALTATIRRTGLTLQTIRTDEDLLGAFLRMAHQRKMSRR
jgi:uncharacterized protein (DUF58 family)